MAKDGEQPGDETGTSRRAQIIARLYRALDRKMAEIEERMERGSGENSELLSPADTERDARSLTSLARLFEKLCELDRGGGGQAGAAGGEGGERDAERIRRGIADRLARLRGARGD